MSIHFIGYNQLRLEYLRCARHSHLHTLHFESVANMDIRFTNKDVQTPICDASRMSFYTGRYTQLHGVQWNWVFAARW